MELLPKPGWSRDCGTHPCLGDSFQGLARSRPAGLEGLKLTPKYRHLLLCASGEVPERPIGRHWKCRVLERVPRVRIPPSPPTFALAPSRTAVAGRDGSFSFGWLRRSMLLQSDFDWILKWEWLIDGEFTI